MKNRTKDGIEKARKNFRWGGLGRPLREVDI